MRPAKRCRAVLTTVLGLCAFGSAGATDTTRLSLMPLSYGLTGDPLIEQTLLGARWGGPSTTLRLDSAAALGAHEVRILSTGSAQRWGPQFSPMGSDSLTDVNIDPVRATYRYTLLAQPTWAMKFGLSTNLGESSTGLRAGTERTSFGSLPLVHFAGIGQWSQRWRLGFAVDGLATTRGRALDLGVQVDYLWSDSMSFFGGYQVTDAAGEAEGYYGSLTNRANVGLRYRF